MNNLVELMVCENDIWDSLAVFTDISLAQQIAEQCAAYYDDVRGLKWEANEESECLTANINDCKCFVIWKAKTNPNMIDIYYPGASEEKEWLLN